MSNGAMPMTRPTVGGQRALKSEGRVPKDEGSELPAASTAGVEHGESLQRALEVEVVDLFETG